MQPTNQQPQPPPEVTNNTTRSFWSRFSCSSVYSVALSQRRPPAPAAVPPATTRPLSPSRHPQRPSALPEKTAIEEPSTKMTISTNIECFLPSKSIFRYHNLEDVPISTIQPMTPLFTVQQYGPPKCGLVPASWTLFVLSRIYFEDIVAAVDIDIPFTALGIEVDQTQDQRLLEDQMNRMPPSTATRQPSRTASPPVSPNLRLRKTYKEKEKESGASEPGHQLPLLPAGSSRPISPRGPPTRPPGENLNTSAIHHGLITPSYKSTGRLKGIFVETGQAPLSHSVEPCASTDFWADSPSAADVAAPHAAVSPRRRPRRKQQSLL